MKITKQELLEYYRFFDDMTKKGYPLKHHLNELMKCEGCDAPCCKVQEVDVIYNEARVIAEEMGIPFKTFLKRYAKTRRKGVVVIGPPCPFYDGKCTIYEVRPLMCRNYPFLSFENVANQGLVGYSICPESKRLIEYAKDRIDEVVRALMNPNLKPKIKEEEK